jgi:hypothetical protein
VSERRVRQLVNEGKLAGTRGDDGVVRIAQQAVNEERKRRRGTTKAAAGSAGKAAGSARKRTSRAAGAASAAAEPVDVDALATAVASAVGQRLEGQLEITRQAESSLRDELAEERARRAEVEAKLAEAERQLADIQAVAVQRKGLFRRRT